MRGAFEKNRIFREFQMYIYGKPDRSQKEVAGLHQEILLEPAVKGTHSLLCLRICLYNGSITAGAPALVW